MSPPDATIASPPRRPLPPHRRVEALALLLLLATSSPALAAAPAPTWAAVWAGAHGTCARDSTGAAWCWGDAAFGRLGPEAGAATCGDSPCWPTPHRTPALDGATRVALGWFNACWIGADGRAACTGADHYGALGDGPGAQAVCTAGGGEQADCSVNVATGAITCAGTRPVDAVELACAPRPVAFLDRRVTDVAVSGSSVCARAADGWWCAGAFDGSPPFEERCGSYGDRCTTRPVLVGSDPGIDYDSSGRRCTRDGRGSLSCAGVLSGAVIEGVTSFALGSGFVCGLTRAGGVVCQGSDAEGSLGRGDPPPPDPKVVGWDAWGAATLPRPAAPVAGLTGVTRLATSRATVCALDGAGAVWCWGRNRLGQVGVGDTVDRFAPVRVEGLPPAADVAVGDEHVCALGRDGSAWCWGSALSGELGVPGGETCEVDYVTATERGAPCATRPQRVPVPAR